MKLTFNKLIFFLILIMLILSICRYFNEENSFLSKQSLLLTVTSAIVVFVLYFCHRENNVNLRRNNFKISTIFCLSFFIVHFLGYLSYGLGVNDKIMNMEFCDNNIINEAAICSLCSFICFVLGYLSTESTLRNTKYSSYESKKYLEYFMFFFLCAFYFFTDKRYFQPGGNGLILNSGGFSITGYVSQTSFQACLLGASIIRVYRYSNLTIKQYVKSYSLIYYISLLIYIYLTLISGDRGPLIMIAFSYSLPYFVVNKKKMGLQKTLLFLTVSISCLMFLASLRSLEQNLSISKMEEAYSKTVTSLDTHENTFFFVTHELSDIVGTYHVVYDYAKKNGNVYGIGFIDQLLGIIPGLRPLLYPIIGFDNRKYGTSLLSTSIIGADVGLGTTCVSESFFNLGFIGTLIFFYMFGFIVKKLDILLYQKNPKLIFFVLAVSYLVYSVNIGRASVFTPLNLFIYTYVYILICSKLYKINMASLKKYSM
ncbi:O-antigen polymerase [Parabacteroides sp. APC149_11_2_Y6]